MENPSLMIHSLSIYNILLLTMCSFGCGREPNFFHVEIGELIKSKRPNIHL